MTMELPDRPLTLADFDGTFTLNRLMMKCDGDEGKMWGLYFNGGLGPEIQPFFLSAVHPVNRTTAVILKAFLRASQVSVKE